MTVPSQFAAVYFQYFGLVAVSVAAGALRDALVPISICVSVLVIGSESWMMTMRADLMVCDRVPSALLRTMYTVCPAGGVNAVDRVSVRVASVRPVRVASSVVVPLRRSVMVPVLLAAPLMVASK